VATAAQNAKAAASAVPLEAAGRAATRRTFYRWWRKSDDERGRGDGAFARAIDEGKLLRGGVWHARWQWANEVGGEQAAALAAIRAETEAKVARWRCWAITNGYLMAKTNCSQNVLQSPSNWNHA